MNRCLKCYMPLGEKETGYHEKCAKKFFGVKDAPALPYKMSDIEALAKNVLERSVAVPGVQAKLSLDIEGKGSEKRRFTFVGLWGRYILKPPSMNFRALPENEDLTMHLSEALKIKTAEHSLIRMASGELAYITKRFDRTSKGGKLHMEDMAQLTGTLTEDKYKRSSETAAKAIENYSANPGLDIISFFEVLLFSFITGNSDMHLKNFTLLTRSDGMVVYSPAYDMLSVRLAMPEDKEELALTLQGKKSSFKKKDFDQFASGLHINEKALQKIYKRFASSRDKMKELINMSFLPQDMKEDYAALIDERLRRLDLL